MKGKGFVLGSLILGGAILVWLVLLSIIASAIIAVAAFSQMSNNEAPQRPTPVQQPHPNCVADPYQYGCPQ
jgi:hypothetical protein